MLDIATPRRRCRQQDKVSVLVSDLVSITELAAKHVVEATDRLVSFQPEKNETWKRLHYTGYHSCFEEIKGGYRLISWL